MGRSESVKKTEMADNHQAINTVHKVSAFCKCRIAEGTGVVGAILLAVLLPAILLLLPPPALAQGGDVLTLQEAIRLGLQRNHGILVARNRAEADALNRSPGNAGFLPSIEASGTMEQREEVLWEIGGGEQNRSRLSDEFQSVEISLDWTIFDGLKMFTTWNRLSELKELGEMEAKMVIENTIVEIIRTYFELVRQKKLLEVLGDAVRMSEERVEISRTKQSLGSGSEYETLLARSDLNADRAAVVRQEVTVRDVELQLARLLDIEQDFEIEENIDPAEELDLEELLDGMSRYNPELEAARLRASVARLELREIHAGRLPQVDFNLAYGGSRSDENLPSLLREELAGLRFGVTARIPIFDGFDRNRRAQIARIERRNREIEIDETRKVLESALLSEYNHYVQTLELVRLESENLDLARRALEIAVERFRLGTITSVEFRETQRMVLDTESRLITALYQSRVSEAELLRLSGLLGRQLL